MEKDFKDEVLNAGSAKQALSNCKAKSGYTGNLRGMQRVRSQLHGRTDQAFYKQYRNIKSYLEAMKTYNPGSVYELHTVNDSQGRTRFNTAIFAHGPSCKVASRGKLKIFSMDTSFIQSRKIQQQLYIFTGDRLRDHH